MPVEYSNLQQKKVENIQITQDLYKKQQEQSWSLVKDFKDTNASHSKASKKKTKYDTMEITRLRDELSQDSKSKSDSFNLMYSKVDRLLVLALNNGAEKDEQGNALLDDQGNAVFASFYDTFFEAKEAVNRYIFNHSRYHFSDKGESRLQIALRIQSLINEMQVQLDDQQNALYTKEARLQNYQQGMSPEEIKEQEDLVKANAIANDVKNFLVLEDKKSGIPEEEENKSIQTWVSKGYSAYLAQMLDGKEITSKEDRNGFLAFMEEQNNRFVANKIAAAMILDRRKDITMNMPWVREMLEKRLKEKLEQKDLFSKPAEFALRVNDICDAFKVEKAATLKAYKKRCDKMVKDLELPEGSADLYRYNDAKQLITTAQNSAPNMLRLTALKKRKKETDGLIEEMLKKRFSVATREIIKTKLYNHLGSLRVFGDSETVLTQVDVFFEMLAFVSPEEYRIERQLSNFMDKLKIEEIHRDIFLNALTGQHPEEFGKHDNKHWQKAGEKLSERIQKNTKTCAEFMESKKTLGKSQWERLDETALTNITMDKKAFSAALKAAVGNRANEKKISLREYKEQRSFNDAQNQPAQKRKIKAEEKRIKAIGNDLDEKFYVHMSGDGKNGYLAYRDLAAAYADNKKEIKELYKLENERFEARKPKLRAAIRKKVDPRNFPEYEEKFKWIMSGLVDITEDMPPEIRLRYERRNLERFGVRNFDEALQKIVQIVSINKNINEVKQVKDAKALYDQGVKEIEDYENGKYKEFTAFILNIPQVYAQLLKGKEALKEYLSGTLDAKLKDFMEGCNKAGKSGQHVNNKTGYYVSGAVRMQYAYMFLRDIFEGRLSGDAAFFADQLNNFQTKLFNVAPEGGISVCAAMKKAEKLIDKESKKSKLKGDESRVPKLGIMQFLYEKAEDAEGLKFLMNGTEVEKFTGQKFKDLKTQIEKDKQKAAIKANITNEFNWEIIEDNQSVTDVKEEIKQKKLDGTKERLKFLMVNDYVLQEVRQCKTLVRVAQKGEAEITLDQSRIDKMRDRVEQYCDGLDLPQVFKDALIERGAEGGIIPAITNTYGSSELLYNHGLAMMRMYNLLRMDQVGDKGMSDEEAQMFVIRCYGKTALHKDMFDKPEKLDVAKIRQSDDLKAFRAGYKKLKEFEKRESDDPSLQEEIYSISRNLRTMLITGMGVRNEQGKTVEKKDADSLENTKRIEKAIDNSIAYADYWNKVMPVIRPIVYDIISGGNNNFTLPEHYMDSQMAAIRQFLMPDVLEEIKAKRDFDEQLWKNKLEVFRNNSNYRKYLESDADSISKDEFLKKEQSSLHDSKTDESAIEKLIDSNLYVFKGKLNKYKELDDDQKKLFALGLMYLDKSAIGLGSDGTMVLTLAQEHRAKDLERVQQEIENYVQGREFHFEINYREAVNKLISYGVTSYGATEHTMSVEAYEMAMKFAKSVSAKKMAMQQKDMERMADPKYAVFAAYTKFGKTQQTKIDAYKKRDLTILDVKNRLLDFAIKDRIKAKAMLGKMGTTALKKVYTGPVLAFKELGIVDKTVAWNNRIDKIVKRFTRMSDGDMKLLVRILQERTVLDKSCIKKGDGSPLYVDQLKRNALLEALAGDPQISAQVLEGFDNSEACIRALTSALGFKLRDDKNFVGKDITKDCFDKSSFDRDTVVDWELIENAFRFFDEVMEKRTSIMAARNSGQLIKFAGNEKATKAHEKLQQDFANKEDFKQQDFETTVKEHANHDGREDIDSALAGYHALTDQQKVLFFKALGSRDILDISKKDYNKSFFGLAERKYVNEAGRDKLIDQYINALRDDNIGLTLEAGEYYRAMEALYTTQISDRVKLTKVKDVTKIFSYERNFIMGRSTAIDWKLFKRALNFVNRATAELEMTEGNALLYRGAGDLEKTGRMNMNYGFLRKNFHRTGNQWGRKLIIHGGSAAKGQIDQKDKTGKYLNIITKASNTATKVSKVVGFESGGYVQGAFKQVNEEANQVKKEKNELEKQTVDAQTLRYEKLKGKINDIVNENRTAKEIFTKVKEYLDVALAEEVDASVKQFSNFVEEEAKDATLDKKKGDFRDDVDKALKAGEKIKKVQKTVKDVYKVVKNFTPDKAIEFIELMDYTVEKAAHKFVTDKVLGVKTEHSGTDELQNLKADVEKYVEDIYNKSVGNVVGNEYATKMKELSDKYLDYKKHAQRYMQSALKGISFIKYTSDNVMNIASCASNIRSLNAAKEQSAALKDSDKATLDKAKNSKRLDEGQLKKAQNAADVNSGLADTGASISKAMQGLGIAQSTINVAMETAKYAGVGLGLGTAVMTRTINAGLEFVNFAVRVLTDRNALKDYYIHTDAGKREVEKIKSGYQAAGNNKLYDKFKKESDAKTASTSLVDMISDAKGYEHTEELVENTGMAMAQSIIFSASDYNPMAESKLMAITVMSVMKLENLIGDTSQEAVEKLFDAFKMKR